MMLFDKYRLTRITICFLLAWGSGVFGAQSGSAVAAAGGWKVAVDQSLSRLNVQHERLGIILEDVRLNLAAGDRISPLNNLQIDSALQGRLVVKTSRPGTTWIFECGSNSLTISSTAPGATLTARVPVSPDRGVARVLDREGLPVTWQGTGEVAGTYGGGMTRNPSFLPRENPECMYFALGSVSGSVFHSLFDRRTDIAVTFPEQSRLSANGRNNDWLDLVMPIAGAARVRLIPEYYTKTLGVPYYIPFDDSEFRRAPMVWCSWTSYYGDVTEEAIVRNTDWLAEHLKPYGFQYVQIDDGYDRGPKEGHNWIDHWDQNKFPRGPGWIAGYIKSKGLHPGLWLVPNSYAGAVGTHPDWYLRDRQGNIVRDYDTPALDSSHPEVLGFLQKLFGTLGAWGFEYYKFDGEHALPKYAPPVDATRLHDPTTDALAVYRHRLEVIRQAIGPKTFVEGCPAGTPLNGIGCFNSYFNGQDVYNNWQGMYALFSSINANAFLNHMVVYVMPGEGMELGPWISVDEARRQRPAGVIDTARSREEPMTGFGVSLPEARTLVSLVALSGVVYPLAGVMPELPAERLDLLQKTLPTLPILPLDLFSRGTDVDWDTFKHVRPDDYIHHYPEILDLKVNANSGVYDVVALPNWRSEAVSKQVSFVTKLGLEDGAARIAFDFWNQKLLGVFKDRLDVEVPGHDTRVILLHPMQDHPQLIGTSRHITGACSIRELSWDAASRTLRGASETVPGEDYTLFTYVPSGVRVSAVKVESSKGDRMTASHRQLGNLLSVSFRGPQLTAVWRIQFAPKPARPTP